MSDRLNQDEVDRLLSQGVSAAGGSDAAYEALRHAFDFFGSRARDVLSTVLNRRVSFAVETCRPADSAVASARLGGDLLGLSLPLTGGVEGVLTLVISKNDTAVLSDLMMLGDGTAAYTDDHRDAIAELFNQIMGAYTSALNDHLTTRIAAGRVSAGEFSFAQPWFALEDADMAVLSMSIEGIGESYVAIFSPRAMATWLQLSAPEEGAVALDLGEQPAGMTELATAAAGAPAALFTESTFPSRNAVQAPKENVEMLLDVELDVSIELGKANLSIKRILDLAPGAIIELDRMAGEPVDLVVNGKVVAKGEVVVVDENFGIRIVSLVPAEERIRSLR